MSSVCLLYIFCESLGAAIHVPKKQTCWLDAAQTVAHTSQKAWKSPPTHAPTHSQVLIKWIVSLKKTKIEGLILTGGGKNLAPPVRAQNNNMPAKVFRAESPRPFVFNIEGCAASSHEPTATAKETKPNIECEGFKGRRRRQLHGASVSMKLKALWIQTTIVTRQRRSKWCKVFSTTGLKPVASRVLPKRNRWFPAACPTVNC